MCTLNTPGSRFGKLDGVKAMTDVTGFGLLGHLVELAEGSGLTAHLIDYDRGTAPARVSTTTSAEGCVRRWDPAQLRKLWPARSAPSTTTQKHLLCDPQTSGGLLVAVTPEGETDFLAVAAELGLQPVAYRQAGRATEPRGRGDPDAPATSPTYRQHVPRRRADRWTCRAPVEFAKGAFPGVVNLPLMNDQTSASGSAPAIKQQATGVPPSSWATRSSAGADQAG